ncbi:MAG: hypothetical protein M5U08_25790 [Burkholderiales bacterium]|nr:hypothetical protein [Burkholderiales bacterium]
MSPSIAEILTHTPVVALDAAIARELERSPADEVRKALVEVLKRTPMEDFGIVRDIYLKRFGAGDP